MSRPILKHFLTIYDKITTLRGMKVMWHKAVKLLCKLEESNGVQHTALYGNNGFWRVKLLTTEHMEVTCGSENTSFPTFRRTTPPRTFSWLDIRQYNKWLFFHHIVQIWTTRATSERYDWCSCYIINKISKNRSPCVPPHHQGRKWWQSLKQREIKLDAPHPDGN